MEIIEAKKNVRMSLSLLPVSISAKGKQYEHWRMRPIRDIGAHRTWLPWISVNRMHGITVLGRIRSVIV